MVLVLMAVTLSAILGIMASCNLFSLRKGRKEFRHDVHIAKRLTCDACHYGYETEAFAGVPTYRTCLACHGPTDQRTPYDFEIEIQKKDPQEAFPVKARFFDLKFSHASHVQRKVNCSECHGFFDRPEADTCHSCHRKKGVAFECSLCHEQTRRDVRPPSHTGSAWLKVHGKAPSLGFDYAHRERCQLCHSPNFCDKCHQVEKPQGHTEFFRLRGHGIAVGIERERCTVCHQENFCVRCHEETRPRSHVGSWGGSTARHCLACHQPVASSNCSVCHKSTPSHLLATPIPPPPHPGPSANCYRCHLRPPHADNGTACTSCHK